MKKTTDSNFFLRIKFYFLPIIALILLTTSNLKAQQANSGLQRLQDVKGYVFDSKTKEPLVYATVMIKNSAIGTSTNQRGYFIIPDVELDANILTVSYIGYLKKEIALKGIDENNSLRIELNQTDFQTGEVLIVGEQYKYWKSSDAVSQITISPLTLSKLPSLGEKDIFRSLQLLPGISSLNDGSAGLYVRGGTPDQNLILLDGITVYHVDHFFGFFSAFNADAMKDVQIYKGGFDAKFGGRLSSVVELSGKTGDVDKFRMSIGANLLSANAVAEIPLAGKGSILISARRSYADIINSGIYDKIFGFLSGGEKTTNPSPGMGKGSGMNQVNSTLLPSFYFYDFNAKLSYNLSPKDFVSVSFYNGQDYLDQSQSPQAVTTRGAQSTNANRTITDLSDWGNFGSSIKYFRQWSDRLFSDITISSSHYFSKKDLGTKFDFNVLDSNAVFASQSSKSIQDNNVYDFTMKLDNDYLLSSKHKIGFGVWFSNISTDYKYTVNDSLTILDKNQTGFHLAAYVQDKWKVNDDFDVTVGLRSTYFDPTKKIYLEPRASFLYKLNPLIRIKGAWGNYYQYINQVTSENVLEGSRDFWLISNSELEPGSAQHYILGAEYETTDFLYSIEGYYKNINNLLEFTQRIVRTSQSRLTSLTNYETNFFKGTGYAEGVEFLIQKKFGALNGWVSYTLGKVEYNFPDFDSGDPFPANQDRTHEFKIVGSYETGNWNFSASWVYSTGLPYTAPESQYFIELLDGTKQSYIHVSEKNVNRLPDYHRLDLSASYKFKNKQFNGEFGLSIFNVYDQDNIWYKKYDLSVSPIEVTNVSMLGITPTIFLKLNL
ncbi:MAG: hypothetical protein A2299_01040 [Stygiobacter sp. RIFOXYB2_FULL_37_11]|nr:MAG: hypothetical protein A2299_01040 [Stygiobacter sp. RIFOXYB2_FULL_37_11]OGV79186.1 MAG: hypothetical protein A2X65_01680 [Stygiobacter sp. GWF2_38_21]